MRFLIGDEVADMLDVPKSDWTRALLPPLRLLLGLNERLDHQSAALNLLSNLFGRSLLTGIEQAERGGNRPMFHVPEVLREIWGLAARPR
jgi:hypothetical protein